MTTPNNTVAGLVEKLKNWRERLLKHTRYNGHRCEFRADCEAVAESMKAALASPALSAGVEVEAYQPQHGEPPSWFAEWFIAKLDTGERVVLRRLPEEYTYDYTTADATYYKAFRLKWWMQFPDSEFKQLESALQHPAAPSVPDLDAIVSRFLCWRLPNDFAPDNGISFTPISNPAWTHDTWPTGTNLLHAGQAKAMFAYCMEGAAPSVSAVIDSELDDLILRYGNARCEEGKRCGVAGDESARLYTEISCRAHPLSVSPAVEGGLPGVAREILAYAMDESQCWNAQLNHWIIQRDKLLDWHRRLATPEQSGSAVQGEARFVPGVMHCAKCNFRLVRTNFYAANGAISAGDNKTEPCPNGCGPLWPVTWEQEARECWARLEELAGPPPAPAAEQGDETSCGCTLDYRGQHITVCPERPLAFGLHDPSVAFNQAQPEARGVEGMVDRMIARYLELEPGEAENGVTVDHPETRAFCRELLLAAAPSGMRVDDAMVERAMRTRIPGGSEAWVWLFNCEGGMAPEEKHRNWFHRILTAALAGKAQEKPNV